jgi:hypothetical protein
MNICNIWNELSSFHKVSVISEMCLGAGWGSAQFVSPRGYEMETRVRIPWVTSLVECGMDRLGFKSRSHVLSVETHRRAATGNTRSREAPGTAGGLRSLGQRPRIRHTTWRLGLLDVPPDLVPNQKGVDVVSVSFLHAQTRLNVNPSRDRLIR